MSHIGGVKGALIFVYKEAVFHLYKILSFAAFKKENCIYFLLSSIKQVNIVII